MAWFRRSPRAKSALFEDRPSPIPALTGHGYQTEFSSEDLVACLYKGSRVTGELNFHGAARIEGAVDGEIRCQGKLTIGEGAEIRAAISGAVVVIHGQVEGDVTAKERVELGAPARLLGNIAAPRLVVAEGVSFDGRCVMAGAMKGREAVPPSSNVEAFEAGSPKVATTFEK